MLGLKVHRAAIETFNRFVSYVRNHEGQWWLEEISSDPNRLLLENNAFQTVVRSSAFDWVRWCPPGGTLTTVEARLRGAICESDWPPIAEFVASDRRPLLPLELLANADSLLHHGRRRSAVLEAVSALEVSIVRFSQAPRLGQLLPSGHRDRVATGSLYDQVEALGLRGSVRFLLPLLFTDEVLTTATIQACQEAVNLRNLVAHQGQRDIPEERVRYVIEHVRKACEVLASCTSAERA
jgi:hypothetical protein